MELNGAVGMVAANVKVEFAGTAKSAWNLIQIQARRKARRMGHCYPVTLTKKFGLPAGGSVRAIHIGLGSNPSPTLRSQSRRRRRETRSPAGWDCRQAPVRGLAAYAPTPAKWLPLRNSRVLK